MLFLNTISLAILSFFNIASPIIDPASELPQLLKEISDQVFPPLQEISIDVYNHPEESGSEYFAHDRVVSYYQYQEAGLWNVTPNAFGEDTAWTLSFTNNPEGYRGRLPSFGFMCEYDALPGIGHACGHNLILLNGLAAANVMRQAVIRLGIPANITVIGTPDEEVGGGKRRMHSQGAFRDLDVVVLAHPSIRSAIQPMQTRRHLFLNIREITHPQAIQSAYEQLIVLRDLQGNLPGSFTTIEPILRLGDYSINAIATEASLGIFNIPIDAIRTAIASVKSTDAAFSNISYILSHDLEGVSVCFYGPGGHAALGRSSPLALSIEVYRNLAKHNPTLGVFLPGNNTITEVGIAVSIRTRYNTGMAAIKKAVLKMIPSTVHVIWDVGYPSLEVTPVLPDMLKTLMATEEFERNHWVVSDFAPAATDASFIQRPLLDSTTNNLTSAKQVVFHPNYNICPPEVDPCPFNHMPEFASMANTNFAYKETEKIARALAHLMVNLASDPGLMRQVKAITNGL